MFAKRRHAVQGRTALSIGAVSLAAVLIAAVPAIADPMDFMAGNIQAGPLYDADALPDGQWSMPASLSEGQFTGGTVSAGANFYFIDPFSMLMDTLDWTGNPLTNDLSGTGPYAPGQAAAEFGPGGTFTINGTLYDMFFTPVFTGVLMSGGVSGFSLFEPSGGADNLQIIDSPLFFPVSGALVDGSFASMTVPYIMNLTIAGAMQAGGGPLTDFQSDIIAIDSMQLEMSPVPEPTSILLLLGGVALLSARRR